ncbi:unnamed protein product [Knipowitschia caucasica]|uniref:Uncharacterized protein n=1 Tax=Knipowitschia caucasica TaxID=637954 RepID=A0AAV2JBT8_KNICA
MSLLQITLVKQSGAVRPVGVSLEWEGAKLSPCPDAPVECDGTNSSVRPELLWTLGCPVAKVIDDATIVSCMDDHLHNHLF